MSSSPASSAPPPSDRGGAPTPASPYAPPGVHPRSHVAPARADRPRGRGVALLLTLLCPGLGHAYLGRPWRGAAWAVGMVPLAAFATLASRATGGAALVVEALLLALVLVAVAVSVGAFVDVALVRAGNVRVRAPMLVLLGVAFFVANRTAALSLRRFAFEAFAVPAGSMMPTLLPGDHLFVAKGHAPRRGELVVFPLPEHPESDYVSRILAVGGDRISFVDGHPIINGWQVPRCELGDATLDDGTRALRGTVWAEFLDGHAYLTFHDAAAPPLPQTSWRVPEGEMFVAGDNRDNAFDSRMWFGGRGGSAPVASSHGTPVVAWINVSRHGAIDTSRIGQRLDVPTLPRALEQLAPALVRCLAAQPPRAQTVPPAP